MRIFRWLEFVLSWPRAFSNSSIVCSNVTGDGSGIVMLFYDVCGFNVLWF